MSHEWVSLGVCESLTGSEVIAAVSAALKCRRVVQVRRTPKGAMDFYARVPLPQAVRAAMEGGEEKAT